MKKIYVLVIGMVSIVLTMSLYAQDNNDGIPDNCEYTDGEFYQENVFVRNDRNNGILELVDWTTGEELSVIAENVGEARIINWSPNCRYVAVVEGVSIFSDEPNIDGSIDDVYWTRYADIEVHIVDAVNGGVVQTIPTFRNANVLWSPANDRAIIYPWFYWNATTNAFSSLRGFWLRYDDYPNRIDWDYENGRVWLIAFRGVGVYDINNGEEISRFENRTLWRSGLASPDSRFTFSTDRTWIIIYGTSTYDRISAPAITLWHIDTMTDIRLNVNDFGGYAVAMSDDNRYLGVAGNELVRIWDLQNLAPEPQDRTHIFTFPTHGNWWFTETTYETQNNSGDIYRYSLETGELLP